VRAGVSSAAAAAAAAADVDLNARWNIARETYHKKTKKQKIRAFRTRN